jgi:hypothetical protein
MVLGSYPPPAMAAAPIDPFAELASSVSNLEALAACLKIQLQDLRMQVLQRPQPPADGELTVNLRMDLSSECLKRLCDGLAAAVKPNGGYRALTTDDDISGEFIGEQQVGVEWWLPEHGCDSLENTLDSIKGRLFAAVRDWLPTAVISTPQPLAPLVPATSAKMPKHVITDVIVTQLPLFLASRSKYHVRQFREHCKPFLPIGTADIEPDCDGIPKWYGRFNYSHNQVARLRGFIANNRGKWKVPAGYK